MTGEITVDGLYATEANAGKNLRTSRLWFGTLIKWRYGKKGRWNRFNAIDVHPWDVEMIEHAVRQVIDAEGREAKP